METNNLNPSDGFFKMLADLSQRVKSLETAPAGSIVIRETLTAEDPVTGVATIIGTLPDGTTGLKQWVNDITPPNQPSTPVLSVSKGIITISWDGTDILGGAQPLDYDKTIVEMSNNGLDGWVAVDELRGNAVSNITGQPNEEERYFRLTSLDMNANASTPSNTVHGHVAPLTEVPELAVAIAALDAKAVAADTKASNAQTTASSAATAAGDAATAAGTAADIAAGKGKVLVQSTAPGVSDQNSVTLWIDTTGGANTPKRWSGSSWVAVTDKTATDAASLAAQAKTAADLASVAATSAATSAGKAQTAADGKSTVWYLSTAPSGTTNKVGDTWFDAANGNRPNTWNGTSWVPIQDAAISLADGKAQSALTAANGKNTNYYQTSQPTGGTYLKGDLWFDTDDGYKLYTYTGSTWQLTQDTNSAMTLANGKNKSSMGATAPVVKITGDVWIDTGNGNVIKSWDGTKWASAQDAAIAIADGKAVTAKNTADAANTAAGTAQTAADQANAAALAASGIASSKGKVLVQSTAPGVDDRNTNTLWIDTTNGSNTPKRWTTGTTWVAVTDKTATDAAAAVIVAQSKADLAFNTATSAATAAGNAQTSADSKGRVWYQDTAPAGTGHNVNDTWFQSPNNTVNRWNGTSWVSIQDTAISSASQAAAAASSAASIADGKAVAAQTKADAAQSAVDSANTTISAAQADITAAKADIVKAKTDITAVTSTANGKNSVFYQTAQPSGGTYVEGDLWFDTDDGYKLYTYTGSTWQVTQDAVGAKSQAIAASATDAQAKADAAKQAAIDAAAIVAQSKADAAKSAAITAAAADAKAKADAVKLVADAAADAARAAKIATIASDRDPSGVGKWLFTQVQQVSVPSNAPQPLEYFATTIPTLQNQIPDAGSLVSNIGNYYYALFRTNIRVAVAKSLDFTFSHDDGCSIYVDSVLVYTKSAVGTGVAVSIPVTAGWHMVDIVLTENSGDDYVKISPLLGTLVDELVAPSTAAGAMAVAISAQADAAVAQAAATAAKDRAEAVLVEAKADAKTKADAAQAAAVASATTMTNGIGKNLSSTAAPTTSNTAPNGSVWRRTDASGRIIGVWEQTGAGVAGVWTPRLITSDTIDNLDVGKLSASSATIDSAVVNKISIQAASVIQLDASRITTGSISADRLDANAVRTKFLAAGKIVASELATDSVTADAIKANAVTAVAILAGTITANEIKAGTITSASGVFGTVDASIINAGTINAARLDAGDIRAKFLSAGKITAVDMVSGTITANSGVIGSLDIGKVTTGTLNGSFITGKSIEAAKLFIGSLDNLIMEPDFSSLGTGWNLSSGMVIVAGVGRLGGNILRITGGTGNVNIYPKQPISICEEKDSYRLAAWVKSTVSAPIGSVKFNARFRSGTGTFSYGIMSNKVVIPANTWTRINGIVTAPANTVGVEFYAETQALGTSATTDYDYVSAVRAGDGSLIVDGAITAGSAIIDTGAIGTAQIGDATITTAKITDLAVTDAKISTINAGKITAGFIDAARIAAGTITTAHMTAGTIDAGVLTAGSITTPLLAAKSITADKLVLTSSDNLVSEGDFGAGGVSWPSPITINPTGGRVTGSACGQIVCNNTQQGGYNKPEKIMTAGAGSQYKMTAWVKSTVDIPANSVSLYIKTFNAAGTQSVVSVGNAPATAANTWVQITGYRKMLDTDLSMSFGIFAESTLSSGTLSIDSVSVTRMNDASLIVDGAIDGITITGAVVRTAASGARIQLDSSGFHSWNASGTELVTISSSDGSFSARGNFSSSFVGPDATQTITMSVVSPLVGLYRSAGLQFDSTNRTNQTPPTIYSPDGNSLYICSGASVIDFYGGVNTTLNIKPDGLFINGEPLSAGPIKLLYDGTYLNNLVTVGQWAQNQNAVATTAQNYPVNLAGMLEVTTNGTNMVYQRYTEFNTGIIHTRTKYNSTWGPWSEVAQESAWVKLANASGWSDYVGGGGYRSGTWARRFGDNVQITGMVKGSSGVMANLPSNLRPTYSALYPAIAVGQPCGIYVMGNNGDIPGNIQYLFGPSAPTYVNITLTIPLS